MRSRALALLGFVLVVLGRSAPLLAQATAPDRSLQQEGFTPIEQLPPQDQLPAAPLLIAAYIFVVAVLFVYLFSLAKRLSSVQAQIARLEGDVKRKA